MRIVQAGGTASSPSYSLDAAFAPSDSLGMASAAGDLRSVGFAASGCCKDGSAGVNYETCNVRQGSCKAGRGAV